MAITASELRAMKSYLFNTPEKREHVATMNRIAASEQMIDNITDDQAIHFGPDYEVALVQVKLPNGQASYTEFNYCTHYADVTHGGVVYKASGQLMNISDLKLESGPKENRNTITLVGLEPIIRGALFDADVRGNSVTIMNAFIKSTGEVLSAYNVFSGTIRDITSDSARDTATISVNCTGFLSKLAEKKGNRNADAIHKDRFANDKFFEYASRQEAIDWELTED